jgi:hypothetical protein
MVQVLDPAVIVSETAPSSTPPINSIVTFNVAATGDLLEYAWRRTSTNSYMTDGSPNVFTNGSETPNFTIQALANVPAAGTEGSYACEISNPVSAISSSEMAIYTSAPSIVNQPLNLNGAGFTSITATGSAISYSWEYGGVGITGQTSHTMSLAPAVNDGYLTQAMLDTNDDFRCRVYNGVGQVISNTFKIIPFKDTSVSIVGGGSHARTSNAIVAGNCDAQMIRPADTTFVWTKNGTPVGSDVGAHGQSLPILTLYNLQPGDAGTYICSCSFNGSSSMSDSTTLIVTDSVTNHDSVPTSFNIFTNETVELIEDYYYDISSMFGSTLSPGSYRASTGWRNIAYGSSSFDTKTWEIYVPCYGTVESNTIANSLKTSTYSLVGSQISPGSSSVWRFQFIAKSTGSDCGGAGPAPVLTDPFPNVSLDGVGSGLWAAPSTSELTTTVTKLSLPDITVDLPVSTSATLGDSVSLSVTATGDAALEYRWYRNGVWRPAYTSDTYSIGSAGYADSGSYVCIVGSRSTHDYRIDTSITARLDVSPP